MDPDRLFEIGARIRDVAKPAARIALQTAAQHAPRWLANV
jgi:hypothetical protein